MRKYKREARGAGKLERLQVHLLNGERLSRLRQESRSSGLGHFRRQHYDARLAAFENNATHRTPF
eukprot:1725635-Alexandrium_andersonii.AAC.1